MDWFNLFDEIAERMVEDADPDTKRRTRWFVFGVGLFFAVLGTILFWGM